VLTADTGLVGGGGGMEVPIKRLMRTGLRKGGGIFIRIYSGIYMNNIYIYIYICIYRCMYVCMYV